MFYRGCTFTSPYHSNQGFFQGGAKGGRGKANAPLALAIACPPLCLCENSPRFQILRQIKGSTSKFPGAACPRTPPTLLHALYTNTYLPPHTISFCTPLGKKLNKTLVRGKIVNGTHKSNSVIPMILHFLVLASVLKVYTSPPHNKKNTLLYCTRGTRTCHIHYELLVQ